MRKSKTSRPFRMLSISSPTLPNLNGRTTVSAMSGGPGLLPAPSAALTLKIPTESGRDSGQQLTEALEMTRKAVITGLGPTSPIGGDVDTMWANVLAGTSGARPIEKDWVQEYNLPVTFAAQLT